MDSLHPHDHLQQALSFDESELSSLPPQKICSGPCGRILPATVEVFGRDKRVKDGLQSCCKECKNAKRRKPPVVSDAPEGYKRCAGPCGRTLLADLDNFYSREESKDGLNRQCKECIKNRMNDYYDKEGIQEQKKAYRQKPEVKLKEKDRRNTPKVKAYHREYERNRYHRPDVRKRVLEYSHQPEIQERHRLTELRRTRNPHARLKKYEQQREYRRTPEGKAKLRVHFANHRARKRAVKGRYTQAQIQEQLKRQRYRCYYAACGHSKLDRHNGKYVYHVDHTFPLSRVVGTDIPANDIGYLVLTCPSCNTSKGSKFPWEWLEGGRLC